MASKQSGAVRRHARLGRRRDRPRTDDGVGTRPSRRLRPAGRSGVAGLHRGGAGRNGDLRVPSHPGTACGPPSGRRAARWAGSAP